MAIVGVGAVLTVAWGTGCSAPPEPAADVALTRQPDEPLFAGSLESDQQSSIQSAFEGLARDANHAAVSRPIPHENGRWSDVYSAVLYACDDVEMAVIAKRHIMPGKDATNAEDLERWEFRLRTVEDWPGTLTIRRIETSLDGRVYEATASIGTFGDRIVRANALLDAFETQLKAFGRKPRLSEDLLDE